MAAWTKRTWTERAGTNLNKFTKSSETTTSVILENAPDVITEAGTPFTADAMNNIEAGIDSAFKKDYAGEINALTSKATPTGADVIIIENSAGGFAKMKTTLSAIISALVGTIGNASGNVPLSNGTKCANLYAERASILARLPTAAATPALPTQAWTAGAGTAFSVNMDITPDLAGLPDNRPQYGQVEVYGLTNDAIKIYLRDTFSYATWNLIKTKAGDRIWTQLTDASGNAINANSLGGVAAASYAPFVNINSQLQTGTMADSALYTANYNGFLTVGVTGGTYMCVGIETYTMFWVPVSGGSHVTIRIKAGQRFRVTGTFTSASYIIYAAQA